MAVILEIVVILFLILANGVLAMAEIAVVSARPARLQQRAEAGNRGAGLALELANQPDRFLSTVQIGITLVGILAGALGGATLAEYLGSQLGRIAPLKAYSEAIGIGLVVLGITYLSLVIGELLPKRLALNDAEGIAAAMAAPMHKLSVVASPIVRLLSLSTEGLLRLLGVRPSSEPPVTAEEIKILLKEGAEVGVFEKAEQDMVAHVFRLGGRRVSSLMTHRTDIVWLDADESLQVLARKVTQSTHSRYPVVRGSLDNVLGIVRAKELLACDLAHQEIDLKAVLHSPLFVPESTPALKVLQMFKESRRQIALVIDAHGSIQGLVTATDILEAIVGDMPDVDEPFEPQVVQRADGSWLLDGLLPTDELREILGVKQLPGETQGHYHTLGGFVMKMLGRIPAKADHFEWKGLRFEVVDMDRYRVDKVLVARVEKKAAMSSQEDKQ